MAKLKNEYENPITEEEMKQNGLVDTILDLSKQIRDLNDTLALYKKENEVLKKLSKEMYPCSLCDGGKGYLELLRKIGMFWNIIILIIKGVDAYDCTTVTQANINIVEFKFSRRINQND